MTIKHKAIFVGTLSFFLCLAGCSSLTGKKGASFKYDEENYLFVLNSDKESYSVMMGVKPPTGEFHIPSSYHGLPVTEVRQKGFIGCDAITSLVFHGGVTTLNASCFQDCGNITSVTFSESVKRIEENAFSCCGLQEVHFTGENYDYWRYEVYIGPGNDDLRVLLGRTPY